jgi:hypothetical protein
MRTKLCLSIGLFFSLQVGNVVGQDSGRHLTLHEQYLGHQASQDSALLEQVFPDLEKIMGPIPKLPILYQDANTWHLDPNVQAGVTWHWPHLKDEALARALQDAEAVTVSAAVARSVEGTNVILIRKENQKGIAGWDNELTKADSADFLKLDLIHESVRYVLDSRYDLAKRRQACQDAEEWFALEALIEGRAQWVTRQLARRLGKEEYFLLLAERYLHVPDQDKDPALRTISQSVVQKKHWACQQGLAFFEYLETQGLGDVEKLVFSKPPKLTKWIEEPELYVGALKSKRPDLASILARLEKVAPPGTWSCQQQSWTPEMLLQAASWMQDKELVKKIADSFPDGRSLIWSEKNGRLIALTLTRFPTPEGARAYFGFGQQLIQSYDAMQGLQSKFQIRKIPGLTESVEITRAPKQVLQGYVADTAIDITWYNVAADNSWAERIIAALLAADR